MAVRPHNLFTVWTPDEVAECLDGISRATRARLYELLRLLPRADYVVEESAPGDAIDTRRALSVVWSHLTTEQQEEVNAAAWRDTAKNGATLTFESVTDSGRFLFALVERVGDQSFVGDRLEFHTEQQAAEFATDAGMNYRGRA
jgi:hypothetical protein